VGRGERIKSGTQRGECLNKRGGGGGGAVGRDESANITVPSYNRPTLPGIFFFSFWVGKIQEKKSFANCYGID
jgi:hypothetical protein